MKHIQEVQEHKICYFEKGLEDRQKIGSICLVESEKVDRRNMKLNRRGKNPCRQLETNM